MNKEIINYMVNIVSTMEDKDILEFIKEYDNELSFELKSFLVTKISDDNLLIDYVEYISENVDVVLSKWSNIFANYSKLNSDNGLKDNKFRELLDKFRILYGDGALESFDGVCKLYGETYATVQNANLLISNLLIIINNVSNDDEKINLLSLLLRNIIPSIKVFIGNNIFNIGCKDIYHSKLFKLFYDLDDFYILMFLDKNRNYLDKNEILLLFNTINSDMVKLSLVDEYDFIDISMIKDDYDSTEEDKILDILEEIDSLKEDKDLNDESFNNYLLNYLYDIAKRCQFIKDDDFKEEIFKEIYFKYGCLYTPIIATIKGDDIKLGLFDEYNVAGKEGYIDVLAGIGDEEKFRNIYADLSSGLIYGFDGFNDEERLNLILFRRDKYLAYKMLEEKYKELKNNYLDDSEKREQLISQVYDLIGLLDDEDQVDIYNLFADITLPEESERLIIPVRNIEFKRKFFSDFKNRKNKELYSLLKSKKLFS